MHYIMRLLIHYSVLSRIAKPAIGVPLLLCLVNAVLQESAYVSFRFPICRPIDSVRRYYLMLYPNPQCTKVLTLLKYAWFGLQAKLGVRQI